MKELRINDVVFRREETGEVTVVGRIMDPETGDYREHVLSGMSQEEALRAANFMRGEAGEIPWPFPEGEVAQ